MPLFLNGAKLRKKKRVEFPLGMLGLPEGFYWWWKLIHIKTITRNSSIDVFVFGLLDKEVYTM